MGFSFFVIPPKVFGQRIPTPPEYSIALYPSEEVKAKINSDFKHIPEDRRYPVASINIRNRVTRITGGKTRNNIELWVRGYIFDVKDLLRPNSITPNQLDVICGKPIKNKDYWTYQLIGVDGTKKNRGTYFIDTRFVKSKLDSFRVRGNGIVSPIWQTTKIEKKNFEI